MPTQVNDLVGQGRLGSSALPLLGMGRDTPDGRIVLRDVQTRQSSLEEIFVGLVKERA